MFHDVQAQTISSRGDLDYCRGVRCWSTSTETHGEVGLTCDVFFYI